MLKSQSIPSRRYAGVFDIPIKGDEETHGVSPSPEAIGGYYGMGWYEHFRDATTGEAYRVRCSDGVNGGKNAHSPEDEEYRQRCYEAIIRRCHAEATKGVPEIRVSRNERAVMQGFTHAVWLETARGKCDGKQSEDGIDGGPVGHFWGIPVVCDLMLKDRLPVRS